MDRIAEKRQGKYSTSFPTMVKLEILLDDEASLLDCTLSNKSTQLCS